MQHYASLMMGDTEVYGIATLIPGGYSFQAAGSHERRLVDARGSDLMLFGQVALADAQHDGDMLVGGPAMIATHRQQEVA
jgi:hypothetical protein